MVWCLTDLEIYIAHLDIMTEVMLAWQSKELFLINMGATFDITKQYTYINNNKKISKIYQLYQFLPAHSLLR